MADDEPIDTREAQEPRPAAEEVRSWVQDSVSNLTEARDGEISFAVDDATGSSDGDVHHSAHPLGLSDDSDGDSSGSGAPDDSDIDDDSGGYEDGDLGWFDGPEEPDAGEDESPDPEFDPPVVGGAPGVQGDDLGRTPGGRRADDSDGDSSGSGAPDESDIDDSGGYEDGDLGWFDGPAEPDQDTVEFRLPEPDPFAVGRPVPGADREELEKAKQVAEGQASVADSPAPPPDGQAAPAGPDVAFGRGAAVGSEERTVRDEVEEHPEGPDTDGGVTLRSEPIDDAPHEVAEPTFPADEPEPFVDDLAVDSVPADDAPADGEVFDA